MDILSHGLWGAAAALTVGRFRDVTPAQTAAAFALGIAPDVGQLMPVLAWSLTQPAPLDTVASFVAATPGLEPRLPGTVVALSHHLHCLAHSLPVLLVATLAAWRWMRWWLVPLIGWWLHVLLDIPTHSSDYYAVPFLYPFSDYGVDGIAWTTPWVLIVDYAALALMYGWLFAPRLRSRAP